MEIINKTIDYSDLYEQLNKNYPDKKLHDFKMEHVKVVNIPKGILVLKGKDQNTIGSKPHIVAFKVDKFLDFDCVDNVTITNNEFISERGIKDLLQFMLKKLGRA